MRPLFYRALMASTLICQSLLLTTAFSPASAQSEPVQAPAANAEQAPDAASEQVALTEKQIEQLLAARTSINAVIAKIPQDQIDAPNPQIQALLDKTTKSFGFKDYGEYDEVGNNIGFLLDGFDRDTKSFVGHDVMVKRRIAEIAKDRKLSPSDKATQIGDLRDILKSIEPVKFPANITLVTKYYDKLNDMFGDQN